jgi:membrane protease YdiL (CAAX protease family)
MLWTRSLELVLLFAGLPLLFDRLLVLGYRRLLFPVMWLGAAGALSALLNDPAFDRRRLTALPWSDPSLPWIAGRVAIGLLGLGYLSYRLAPASFLSLPKERPLLWLVIFVAYPLLSVLPQALIWRAFFIHRYAPLLGEGAVMMGASALAFAFAHIIFRNAVAVLVTAVGGILFANTYLATGSMLLSSLEHAAYGIAAFTFGLGRYLYLGAARPR